MRRNALRYAEIRKDRLRYTNTQISQRISQRNIKLSVSLRLSGYLSVDKPKYADKRISTLRSILYHR